MPDSVISMHNVLMSVGFGAALAFLVHAASGLKRVAEDAVHWVTWALTLLVIVCLWWWYAHFLTLFPSSELHDYLLDFLVAVFLCMMSLGIKDPVRWPTAWTLLALTALGKLAVVWLTIWLHELPKDAPRATLIALTVATLATVLIAAIAGWVFCVVRRRREALPYWAWFLIQAPVFLGIVASWVVAYLCLP